jgi:hypothetical protein
MSSSLVAATGKNNSKRVRFWKLRQRSLCVESRGCWIAFQSQPEYVAYQIRKKLEGENHAAYRMDFQNRLLDGATGI